MTQDDAELLRLVREWRPSAALHPIAMEAWSIYEEGGHTLSDGSLEKIRIALEGYSGDLVTLGEALEGLTRFSILLSDHQHDETGAERVVTLMQEYAPRFEPFWERVVEAIAKVGNTAPALENQTSDAEPFSEPVQREPRD